MLTPVTSALVQFYSVPNDRYSHEHSNSERSTRDTASLFLKRYSRLVTPLIQSSFFRKFGRQETDNRKIPFAHFPANLNSALRQQYLFMGSSIFCSRRKRERSIVPPLLETEPEEINVPTTTGRTDPIGEYTDQEDDIDTTSIQSDDSQGILASIGEYTEQEDDIDTSSIQSDDSQGDLTSVFTVDSLELYGIHPEYDSDSDEEYDSDDSARWDIIECLPCFEVEIKADGHIDLAPNTRSCGICLEEYERGEMRKVLPCLHGYHEACIGRWLRRHGECPLCKRTVDGL